MVQNMSWAAAIGAGADLIGGAANLFTGNKSEYESRLRYDDAALLSQQNLIDQRNLENTRRWEDQGVAYDFAKNSTGWAFDDLMQAADASGIHRLAALGSTGSSYTPSSIGGASAQPPSPYESRPDDFSFLGDAVSGGLNRIQKSATEKRTDKLTNAKVDLMDKEAKLLEAQAKTMERRSRAATTGGTIGETYPNSQMRDARPKPRPNPGNTPRVPVYSPSGTGPHMIPSDIADRFGIKHYGNLTAGDIAEMVGELAGEGATAVTFDKINRNLDGLLFDPKSKEKRNQQLPKHLRNPNPERKGS